MDSFSSRGRRKRRLGDLLIDAGVITKEQLQEALQAQQESEVRQKLGMTIVDMGLASADDVAEAMCQQLNMERVHLADFEIEDSILSLVDEKLLRKYMLMPYAYRPDNANILLVAMSDPMDLMAMDDLSISTGLQIEAKVTTVDDVSAALDRYFGNAEAMKMADQFTQEHNERYGNRGQKEEESEEIKQAPIVRLLNQIVEQAVHRRASDIHFEPMETQLRIRFRIDGVLQEAMKHDVTLFPALVARIKIVSGMDISEKRKPQDGRMSVVVDRNEYDLRVSNLPTVFGEKVVMRITQKKALTRDKKDLGFTPDDLEKFDKILAHPHGIILVTGPTGSGKSTTLYTALSELNTVGVNIITVEDPVEANLAGINQVQTNPKAGLTFAAALRSILRQDPDIIMIGEIRDQETASIAVEASITGHLVVSTLHTNSAAGTITRLADMEIESYMIADALVGVIAQRLLRRVCPVCKKMVPLTDIEKEEMHIRPEFRSREILVPEANREGKCAQCGGSGYQGRIGIYEILPVSNTIKRVIVRGGSAEEIENQAIREGMKTLVTSANQFVLQGVTTIEEVHRVAYGDE